jgi:DNA-binding PadR family transcriptional regulator
MRANKGHAPDESSSLDLFSGFIKIHALHDASQHRIYGLWLIEELAEHGYHVSPGTLYPLLHSLEKSSSSKATTRFMKERFDATTKSPRRAVQLRKSKMQLIELIGEVFTKEEVQQLLECQPHS